MALVDVGAGAAGGLETLLTRLRLQEETDQRQQTIDEEKRSNKVAEQQRGTQIAQTGRQQSLAEQDRRDAFAATGYQRLLTQADKRVAGQTIGQEVPTAQAASDVSMGVVPASDYKSPNMSTLSMIGATTLPGDPNPKGAMTATPGKLVAPSPIALYQGTGQQRLAVQKETAAEAKAAQTAKQQAENQPLVEVSEGGTGVYRPRSEAIGKPVFVKPTAATGQTATDPNDIADAIIKGEQPPTLQGLYRNGITVRAALARKGFNLATAQTDWNATQKHFATLNGTQQTRLRQAVSTASSSLDVIQQLADQWKGGQFPPLNRANLTAAKNGAYGKDVASVATQLEGQITDVTSELGNVYMGGNSPTDHALGLAAKNLSADWDQKVLTDMIALARANLQIRQNSINNTETIGFSDNAYQPQKPVGNALPLNAAPASGRGGGLPPGVTVTRTP